MDDVLNEFFQEGLAIAEREKQLEAEWEAFANSKETYSDLFDFLRKIFDTTQKGVAGWDNVSNPDKKRNSFMVNRMMAIQYAPTANALNELYIDSVGVVESWRIAVLSSGLKSQRIPSWIYTKTAKAQSDNPFSKLKKETLIQYCRMHECGMRELREMHRRFPSETMEELEYIENGVKEKAAKPRKATKKK